MVTIDWAIKRINIFQTDMVFVSGTLWALDTDALRLTLKSLEASEHGMPEIDTHDHAAKYTVAGVTYAAKFEIINGYTVLFEDGQYAVILNGTNNNLFDEGIVVRNQVSIIPTNSAGLQIVTQGSGVTAQDKLDIADQVWDEATSQHVAAGSMGKKLGDAATVADVPTVVQIADSVWNEVAADHVGAGTTGAALRDAALAKAAGVAVVTGPYATNQILAKDSINKVNMFMHLNSDHFTPATSLTGMTIRMSKNGSSMSIITPTVTEIGMGWYSLALTAAICDTIGPMLLQVSHADTDTWAGVLEIDVKPDNTPGAVTAATTPTAASFSTDLPGASNYWKDSFIRFTTGSLAGQVKKVTAFNSANGVITCSSFTSAPADTDRFILVNS